MTVKRPMKFLRAPAVFACFTLIIAVSSQSPAKGVTGRVVLKGEPPSEREIQMSADCSRLETNRISTRHYLVGTNGGLANVVVFVKAGLSHRYFAAPTGSVTLTFERCQITPYVSAARTRQSIRFANEDKLLHNVNMHSRSNRFMGIAMPTRDQPGAPRAYDKPELFIRHRCDVHPWEYAYLSVFDHPFFAVTGADGMFTLPQGLPDGTYTIEAQHLKAGGLEQQIAVSNGTARIPDLIFQVPPAK